LKELKMNKKLYEVLYYRLQSEVVLLKSTLGQQIHNTESIDDKLAEEAYALLEKLVHKEGCLHTLREHYEVPYGQPAAEPEKVTNERWERLFDALERLDPAYVPPRSTPLTHEELLERSSDYRRSQNPGYTVRKREDEDEE
jgi:hypothetical protein